MAGSAIIAVGQPPGDGIKISMHHNKAAIEIRPLFLASRADRCEHHSGAGRQHRRWTVNGQSMLRPASVASHVRRRIPSAWRAFRWCPIPIASATALRMGRQADCIGAKFFPRTALHSRRRVRAAVVVQSRTADSVVLGLRNRPGRRGPWPSSAAGFRPRRWQLTLDLSAVNLADRAVPLAFGHHPYFPREGGICSSGAGRVAGGQ